MVDKSRAPGLVLSGGGGGGGGGGGANPGLEDSSHIWGGKTLYPNC